MFPLGVDVESCRQVGATHNSQKQQIEYNDTSLRVLERILNAHKAGATFFVFASWARRHPAEIRRLVLSGHEIASRGLNDEDFSGSGQAEFFNGISDARKILEDLSGNPVVGYRVPRRALTPRVSWALPCIQRAGYLYDASITSGSKYSGHGSWEGAKQGLVLDGGPGQKFGFFINSRFNFLCSNSALTLGGTIRWEPLFWLQALMDKHDGRFKDPFIVRERDFRPFLTTPQAKLRRLLSSGRSYRFCDVLEDAKKELVERQEY